MLRSATVLMLAAMLFMAPLAACADYPVLEYYVTDQAGVLYGVSDIEQLCAYVYEISGVQMAVLIVNTTLPDDINLFSTKTFQQNGLGQEGKDNGLLLVIATDENLWRIEVGYGLEGVLPDSLVGAIADTYLVPEIELYGDYYTGIYNTLDALGYEILENYEGEPPKSKYPVSFIPLTWGQWFIVIGIMAFLAIVTKGRIFLFIPWIFGRGKIGGGGRSGGGGAGGKW